MPTIREIRDFHREMQRTNRESVTMYTELNGRKVRPRPSRLALRPLEPTVGWGVSTAGRRYSAETAPSRRNHALGDWIARPQYRSQQDLWEDRWRSDQPDPSFDVDGDGIVSAEDLLVASEFDRDGNGVLDAREKRLLRQQLARQGVAAYYKLPHGPHLKSKTEQLNKTLLTETPRPLGPTEAIDPDSDSWHLRMAALSNKTKVAAHFNSENISACIAHVDAEARPINLMAQMLGKTMKASKLGPQGPANGETPRPAHVQEQEKLEKLFRSIDVDGSGSLDRAEIATLAAKAGKTMSTRQLDDAMLQMDGDGSGQVDLDEFSKWFKTGVLAPPAGSEIFRQVSEKVERKVRNVRTLFRQWDENKDGTVSHHEFRTGLRNLGIEMSESDFSKLIETVDEDGSNEIDYNEFARSGVMGGKFFAARAGGFSGCRTRSELLQHRQQLERQSGQHKMNKFWERAMVDPRVTLPWNGNGNV
eukprot:SAG31_NODE_731_length_12498_cov_7.368336_2_plen_475_part_00